MLTHQKHKKNTKLKSEITLIPDITEPNNEQVAMMKVMLKVKNASLQQDSHRDHISP
jgi:hypothetical protein